MSLTDQRIIKVNDSMDFRIRYEKPTMCINQFEFRDNFNNLLLEFEKTGYPACCGINILYGFTCNSLTVFTEDIFKTFFEKTRGMWRNKTQFVAIKAKVIGWTEDEEGDEISEVIGFENNFDYNNFIEPLIKFTKAKLISEFVNTNSGNKCYVYEFDGEKL